MKFQEELESKNSINIENGQSSSFDTMTKFWMIDPLCESWFF